jgi:hypothetical protein
MSLAAIRVSDELVTCAWHSRPKYVRTAIVRQLCGRLVQHGEPVGRLNSSVRRGKCLFGLVWICFELKRPTVKRPTYRWAELSSLMLLNRLQRTFLLTGCSESEMP